MSKPIRYSAYRRSSRVVPASIMAVLIIALGAAAVVAGGTELAEQRPAALQSVYDSILALDISAAPVRAVAVALVALGLVLFLAAVLPGPRRLLSMAGTSVADAQYTLMSREDVAVPVRAAVRDVDGVETVRVRVAGSKLLVHATTLLHDRDTLVQAIGVRVDEECKRLSCTPPLVPRVTVGKAAR